MHYYLVKNNNNLHIEDISIADNIRKMAVILLERKKNVI